MSPRLSASPVNLASLTYKLRLFNLTAAAISVKGLSNMTVVWRVMFARQRLNRTEG
jgi:hypothetical protein